MTVGLGNHENKKEIIMQSKQNWLVAVFHLALLGSALSASPTRSWRARSSSSSVPPS